MRKTVSAKAKRLIAQFGAIAVLIFADLGIKVLVQRKLAPVGTIGILDGIFDLTYAENTGAAWGMMSGKSTLLSVVVGLVLAAMCIYLFFIKETGVVWHICLPLIIAGGGANLVDRIWHGFVTDYLHVAFIDFPVFNFADCCVVVGCLVLMVYLIVDVIREYAAKGRQGAEHADH